MVDDKEGEGGGDGGDDRMCERREVMSSVLDFGGLRRTSEAAVIMLPVFRMHCIDAIVVFCGCKTRWREAERRRDESLVTVTMRSLRT